MISVTLCRRHSKGRPIYSIDALGVFHLGVVWKFRYFWRAKVRNSRAKFIREPFTHRRDAIQAVRVEWEKNHDVNQDWGRAGAGGGGSHDP